MSAQHPFHVKRAYSPSGDFFQKKIKI